MLTGRRRNTLVVIQSSTPTSGQWGNADVWAEFVQAWVTLEPVRGRERYVADEVETIISHKISGDYMELGNVTDKMQVVYHDSMKYSDLQYSDFDNAKSLASRVFLIKAVMRDYETKGDIVLMCEEEGRNYADVRKSVS